MLKMSDQREFDLIIFGATGFTGFYVIRELLISMDQNVKDYGNLKWAIAGRNMDKMTEKLNEVGQELKKDLSNIVKVVANVTDDDSLAAMTSRTRLVINCVGPYHLYGEPVVRSCVQSGTHHVDISGEPNYIETMVLNYYHQAVDKKLVVVSTCGWDSIPCDLGVHLAKHQFEGRLHSVETFMETIPGPHGYRINFGTLKSAMIGYQNINHLKQIRRQLYSQVFGKKLPRSRIILSRKTLPFKRPEIEGWNVEFPGSDRSVVQRTQYHEYDAFNEPPVQIQTYFVTKTFGKLLGVIMLAIMFAAMIATRVGIRLLESYPETLTFGAFSKKGPSREQIETTRFSIKIFGTGWSKPALNGIDSPDKEPDVDPDHNISVEVNGPDPGYMATSICIVQSALTILTEYDQIPKGVLTPAFAFRKTNLMKRLIDRGMKFEVIRK